MSASNHVHRRGNAAYFHHSQLSAHPVRRALLRVWVDDALAAVADPATDSSALDADTSVRTADISAAKSPRPADVAAAAKSLMAEFQMSACSIEFFELLNSSMRRHTHAISHCRFVFSYLLRTCRFTAVFHSNSDSASNRSSSSPSSFASPSLPFVQRAADMANGLIRFYAKAVFNSLPNADRSPLGMRVGRTSDVFIASCFA